MPTAAADRLVAAVDRDGTDITSAFANAGRPDHGPGHRAEERHQHDHRAIHEQAFAGAQLVITNHPPAARSCSARRPRRGSARRRRRSPHRQHAGDQRERPDDVRGRRAVQHRHRIQAVLPDDDAGRLRRRRLLVALPDPRPRRRRRRHAGQLLLPALRRGQHAGGFGLDDDDRRASRCRTSCASSAAR